MTQEHKDALRRGRELSRVVSAYLDALQRNRPRRGRRVTREVLEARLADVEAALTDGTCDPSPMQRLALVQDRIDITQRLEAMGAKSDDMPALEAGFVRDGAEYAQTKGITRAAFREIGVPSSVLKKAGI